mmetsp:Transcript_29968/g.61679  ORF Transcript_29968/g.61679 Transcript_29968/m.61679 type:complete len:97 (+) Transcript_29968:437-727(+)
MDDGVTYSAPKDAKDLHRLHGWVDSDYAADPDNRRSTSGYLICLRNLMRDLGQEQTSPTIIFEDNASCILMSENPLGFEDPVRTFPRRRLGNPFIA